MSDNLIIERRNKLTKYLNNFFPNDISKLISTYDYYLEGKTYTNYIDESKSSILLNDGSIIVYSWPGSTFELVTFSNTKQSISFKGHAKSVRCARLLSD